MKAKCKRPMTGNQLVAKVIKESDPLLRRLLATVAAWRGTTPERYAVEVLAEPIQETAHDFLCEAVIADERALMRELAAQLPPEATPEEPKE